jgi:hypothetical protein
MLDSTEMLDLDASLVHDKTVPGFGVSSTAKEWSKP